MREACSLGIGGAGLVSQRGHVWSPMGRLAAVLFCALLPWSGGAQSPAGSRPSSPPQLGRDRDFDVRHYRIDVRFDWLARRVIGRTTITARPLRAGVSELALDAADMTVSAVALADGTALTYGLAEARLRIRLDRPRAAGEDVSIVVTHSGSPTRGLRFVGEAGGPVSQIWTVGQVSANRHWFPCQDEPGDLATVETIVAVPDRYRVIGNGVLKARTRDRVRRIATYHWSMAQPIATYLVSIVVGDFAEIVHGQSPPVRSYVPQARIEDARRSLAETAGMVGFYAGYLGVPYPYANYKQTIVREFPGGIENASATTLGESVVYDRRATLDEQDAARSLLAHEVAHQWFGDLVTCRDWSDVWLHEGFATHLAHLYANRAPDRAADLRYTVLLAQRRSQEAWSGGNRRALATTSYPSPDAMFDVHAYATGAVVLDMLRFVLDAEPWRAAMRTFLRRHAFGNVTTADLRSAIEDATGRSVGWFFDQWITSSGFPDLDVSYAYHPQRQSITLAIGQRGRVYRMPVDVAISTGQGERVHRIWLSELRQELTLEVAGEPLIVNFDRGARLMKRVRFEKSAADLAYQARHDPDPMGRIWAANVLKENPTDGAETVLVEMLTRDSFWGARVEAARALGGRRSTAVRTAALSAMADAQPLVRREAARLLASFADPYVWERLRRAITTDESYYVVREATRALVAAGSPDTFAIVERLLATPSEKHLLRIAALDLLGTLRDEAGFDLALPYATSSFPTGVRAAALRTIAVLGRGRPGSRPIVLERLTLGLATGSEPVKLAAVDGLETLADRAAIPHLRAAAESPQASGPNDALLRRRIRDLLRKLESASQQE